MLLPNRLVSVEKTQKESDLRKTHRRWIKTLFVCAVIGIFLGLAGLIINGLSLLGFLENSRGVSRLGIWLIVAAFPLGAVFAHCLDRLEKTKEALKVDYLKKE